MSSEIKVPKLSATMEEATVLQWLKQAGDRVTGGEGVIELETDKTAIEVEATESGYLSPHLAEVSEVVSVGTVLAYILESADAPMPKAGKTQESSGSGENSKKKEAEEQRRGAQSSSGNDKPGHVRVSPKARRLAEEHGIDLLTLEGTGRDGRISHDDVLAAVKKKGGSVAVAGEASPQQLPASAMRQRIAEQVCRSVSTIPQYFVEVTVNTGPLRDVRKRINDALPQGAPERVTYTDFLLQAIADVGANCPELGLIWQDGKPPGLLQVGTANLGLIVALEEGMIIPVITEVDRLSLTQLAEKRAETVKAARANRLGSKYTAPCAISLSNLGATGVDRFQAIVEPGQTAVLAAGAERRHAFIKDDQVVIGTAMTLLLSVDHRVVDGAVAGGFMAKLRARLESDTWRQ